MLGTLEWWKSFEKHYQTSHGFNVALLGGASDRVHSRRWLRNGRVLCVRGDNTVKRSRVHKWPCTGNLRQRIALREECRAQHVHRHETFMGFLLASFCVETCLGKLVETRRSKQARPLIWKLADQSGRVQEFQKPPGKCVLATLVWIGLLANICGLGTGSCLGYSHRFNVALLGQGTNKQGLGNTNANRTCMQVVSMRIGPRVCECPSVLFRRSNMLVVPRVRKQPLVLGWHGNTPWPCKMWTYLV
ncbi:hypothetical protein ACH5RR_030062 [Cinchona calisaya]|uniref:Uncharacterized protein n=1 Tax=Cinchona calisaya TaxID=153742 RepID=A0ABD2YUX5_9GENT